VTIILVIIGFEFEIKKESKLLDLKFLSLNDILNDFVSFDLISIVDDLDS